MGVYTFMNEIAFPLIEGFIILLLFSSLINKNFFFIRHKLKSSVFIISYVIFSYLATHYIPFGYHSLIISLFIVISLSFITASSILSSFIVILLIGIFMMITEFPVIVFFAIFKKVSYSQIININNIRFTISIIIRVLQILITLFIYKSKKSFFKNISSNSNNVITSYLLLGIFLMGIFIFSINYVVSANVNVLLYEVLLFSIFAIFILLGILVFKEKENLLKVEHKYKLQEEYTKNIEAINNVIRREKHDFSNHINTIHAMCVINKTNTIGRIKSYLDQLSTNLKTSYHYYHSGNDYVDGLLAVKSNIAFTKSIHLDIDFEILLSNLSMDSYDLIGIVGNIIDNSFEALLEDLNNKNKIISFSTFIENAQLCISISNNGPMISNENIKTIFENGFSTKEHNTEDHGLGLYIVKQLITKNNGEITVSSNEHETEFLIKFNMEKDKNGEFSPKYHQLNS